MSDETTDLIPAALREAILAGDRRRVLDLVRDLRDPDRLVLGPALMKDYYGLCGDNWTSQAGRDRHAAYQLARLGTAATPQHAAWSLTTMARAPLDEQMEALSPRPVAWKRRFATSALSRAGGWQFVHAWVGAGVVAHPSSNQWTLGVLAVYPWDALPRVAREDPVVAPLVARLLDTPGAGRVLGYRAKHGSGGAWRSLVEACGGFDPDRRDAVIDSCLSQLGLALPTDALGFTTVIAHLDLTDEEVTRRQGRFAALLLAPSPPAQTLAADAVRRVLDIGTLDADTLLGITTEALQGPKKNRIRDHLQLLDDAVARGVVDVAPAADAVADALDPGRSDVAESLAAALGRWSSMLAPAQAGDLRATIEAAVPQPWPELRRALGPLAPEPAAAPTPVVGVPDPVDLGIPDAVVPVGDLDELLVLMEETLPVRTTAVELERALDAMVRLRLDGVPTEVRSRAERATSSWFRSRPGTDVEDVIRAWLGHETPPLRAGRTVFGSSPVDEELPPGATEYPNGSATPLWRRWTRAVPVHDPDFLTSRRLGLVRLAHLAAAPGPLLSLPSSQDGTVGADELLARVRRRAASGLPIERFDLAWAVLRLRPSDRAGLLDVSGDSPELTDWLRAVARTPDWAQPVVAGAFAGYDAKTWHDPGAVAGSMDDPVHAWLDPSLVVHTHDVVGTRMPAYSGLSIPAQWAATLPSHPDVLVAHLQHVVRQALHDPDTDTVEVLVRSLGTQRAPWGRPSTWAVVMGLSAEHRPTRLAASEAIAAGASRGMLDPAALTGALLATVGPDAGPFGPITLGQLRAAHPMLSRTADGLADAAGIDDRTADVVQRAVLAALPELMGRPGGHAIVAVAAQLAERLGRRGETPAAVLELAAGRSRTRTATEARRLVAATEEHALAGS